MTDDRYIEAQTCGSGGELTAAQIEQWRQAGFTFVRDLLPMDGVRALAEHARDVFPLPGSPAAQAFDGFGSRDQFVFPSDVEVFNELALHPHLLRAIGRLLAVAPAELRLCQADLWPKYGGSGSGSGSGREGGGLDQRIHVDYPNHTLVHPSPWSRPEAVELIVYLSDWRDTGGSTAVVPRQGADDPAYRWPIVDSPGIGELRYVNDRTEAEAYFARERPSLAGWRQSLYDRERYTRFRAGDVLFYRHDTWHRGTPMVEGALRLALNVTYRKAASEWISTLHTGWAWQLYRPDRTLNRLIAEASLDQRAVLGFPQPGSDYWCEETLQAVEARYGMYGFDPTPYRSVADGR